MCKRGCVREGGGSRCIGASVPVPLEVGEREGGLERERRWVREKVGEREREGERRWERKREGG